MQEIGHGEALHRLKRRLSENSGRYNSLESENHIGVGGKSNREALKAVWTLGETLVIELLRICQDKVENKK